MCTVLHAIVAAALSLLSGSSAPPLLCAAEHKSAAGTAVGSAVSCGGRRTGSADRASARRAPRRLFFMERSRLVCRHRPRPRAGASKPDRSDGGAHWAPHLIAGRQSDSQARACIVHHVHPSLRHRRRRAFPPRRFVSARSAPVHAWRAVGEGHRGRGRPIAPRPHFMSLAV
jgi:hypothetical protein